MELYRKGHLFIFSMASIGATLDTCGSASREDNLGVVGSVRGNLSLEELWEGEEICGCGHLWPEMLYCRPHPPSYTLFFFFLI